MVANVNTSTTVPNVLVSHTILTPTTKALQCRTVQISGDRAVKTDPNANIDGPVEAQTLAYNNLKYVFGSITFTEDDNTITWNDVLTLYKLSYDGTNAPLVNIIHGGATPDSLVAVSSLLSATDIPMVLEKPNVTIDIVDSRNAYRPQSTLTFVETK